MIEIRNVFKKNILKNISLTLPDKNLVSIIGDSGSGKTTLINIISGIDKPSKGRVLFFGKRIKRSNKDKIRSLNIGMVFQNSYLDLEKTVYKNIEISLRMINLKEEYEVNEKIKYIMKMLNIYEFKDTLCKRLSTGQKSKVALARALVKNPKVIIADEITSALDTKESEEIIKMLKIISKDRLVILITHDILLAKKYSNRIIYIKEGQIYKDIKNSSEKVYFNPKINMDYLDNSLNDIKYSSIYNLKTIFKEVIFDNKKKYLSIGLFLCSLFISFLLCKIYSIKRYKPINDYDKNYIRVLNNKNNYKLLKNIDYKYTLPGSSLKKIKFYRNNYYKFNKLFVSFNGVIKIDNKVSQGFVYIDKLLLEKISNDESINKYLKMIGFNYQSINSFSIYINELDFKIKKVVNNDSPSIYFNSKDFKRLISINNKYQSYNNFKDYLTISNGFKPINDNEAVVRYGTYNYNNLNIVGHYLENYDYIFVNDNTFLKSLYYKKDISIYTLNKKQTIKSLKKRNLTVVDDYLVMNNNILNQSNKKIKKYNNYFIIVTIFSFIICYLIIKTTVNSELNSIIIYRLLGVKKSDIYLKSIINNILLTTKPVFLSTLCVVIFIVKINSIKIFSKIFYINYKIMLFSITYIYIIMFILTIMVVKVLLKNNVYKMITKYIQ